MGTEAGFLVAPDGSVKKIRVADLEALIAKGFVEESQTLGGLRAFRVTESGRRYVAARKARS